MKKLLIAIPVFFLMNSLAFSEVMFTEYISAYPLIFEMGQYKSVATSAGSIEYAFSIQRYDTSLFYINPLSISITLTDIGTPGDTARMTIVKNENHSNKIIRAAKSPSTATVGLSVKHGDKISVIVDFPAGMNNGKTNGSFFVISWSLQYSKWIYW